MKMSMEAVSMLCNGRRNKKADSERAKRKYKIPFIRMSFGMKFIATLRGSLSVKHFRQIVCKIRGVNFFILFLARQSSAIRCQKRRTVRRRRGKSMESLATSVAKHILHCESLSFSARRLMKMDVGEV